MMKKMMMIYIKTTICIALIVILVKTNTIAIPVKENAIDDNIQIEKADDFTPVNGMTIGPNYIVFEAEATDSPLGKWQIITPEDSRYKDNNSVPPINNTHLEFTGNDHNFGPPTSPLEYKFECPKTGTYRLGGRLYQRLEGLPNDKCNDVYIRMAGDFSSGNNIPTSVLKQNEKFFGRGVNKWGSLYSIDSHNHGQAPVLYNLTEGEIYTFTVSGRAQRTNVDYWILYENSLTYTLESNKDIAANNDTKYLPEISTCKTFQAVSSDFTPVANFVTPEIVNRSGSEVLQVPVESEWSSVQFIYNGTQGKASFTLNTMLEKGGESSYHLKVNGVQIGQVINDRIAGTDTANFTIQSHVIDQQTILSDGDTIQIEFNNTSNNLVPQEDSYASSHGILLSLEICTTGEFKNTWRIQHPVIWTTQDKRDNTLELIENNEWANSIVNKLRDHIDTKVNAHISNPATILNTIPEIPSDDNLSEAQATTKSGHTKVLTYASYAGILYYLTEEEKYAQFSADILAYYINKLSNRTARKTTICGNAFYDPRSTYVHFSVAYDFLFNYLKRSGTRVYDTSTGNMVDFDHTTAQKVVRNIASNALQESKGDDRHGENISNHPVLRSPGVLFSILCVEDNAERERLFNVFWEEGTKEQNSFKNTILPMFGEQGIWPESTSYSFMPAVTMILNIVDRLKPEMDVMSQNMHILDGNFLFDNLRMPNRRFVRYGDSHRDNDSTEELYRYTLNLAERKGFTKYAQKAKVALSQSYNSAGGYTPSVPVTTFDNYKAYEQLFWGIPIPESPDGEINFQKPTVIVKHAGIALQRNYVEEENNQYGLCGIIGGAHYVHSHCTGITMELYGSGYIMAANAGLPNSLAERRLPEHENYFWRHAGNNTMIVNGTTHGIQPGSWNTESYLWQNKTVNIAAEPKHLEDPISPNFSFATQFLDDNVNNCDQQRTLSTIRTSKNTGYYFDMFRSRSLGENNFHDYIYHNIGDQTIIVNQLNEELNVSPTNRYQTDIGDPVQSPGWRFFENTEVTEPYNEEVKVSFKINYNNRYMNMYIPGGVEREYAKALGPATREAKNGYDKKKTQIIAIRQQGEAWNKPYVAIFEPTASTESSIVEVEHLYNGEKVIGARVNSKIGDKTLEDYILCLPSDNSITLPEHGISFTGRFAILRYEQDLESAYTTLYIGDGEKLIYGENELTADASRKGIMVKEGEPYMGRILLFQNISNREVIPKGSNLSIEAMVGEDFNEVTLWANDTVNLGTKTEAPYIWSNHPSLTNMQDDTYTFKLVATNKDGYEKTKTIIIETPSQEPYPDKDIPHPVPGKIEFEEYDSGGDELGYFDLTPNDTISYSYRGSNNVELGRNGTTVSALEAGEWLEYTIDVKQAGYYNLNIRHRTTVSPSVNAFNLSLPNEKDTLLNDCQLLYTGRSDFYIDNIGEILLNSGKQTLRFSITDTGFDLDYMELSYEGALGIKNTIAQTNAIKVYPNPAHNFFTIDVKGARKANVFVYDINGRLIHKALNQNNNISISTGSKLKPGIYIIKIVTESREIYYTKLTIK